MDHNEYITFFKYAYLKKIIENANATRASNEY